MKSHGKYRRNYRRYKGRGKKLRERLGKVASAKGLYRSRQGLFMGVCKGMANYFDFSVFWLRVIVFILFLFTGFWPVGVIYLVAGLILKAEPVAPLRDEKDEDFYHDYAHSRESAINRIRRKYDNIERRIQRMEHTVTSREFDWR